MLYLIVVILLIAMYAVAYIDGIRSAEEERNFSWLFVIYVALGWAIFLIIMNLVDIVEGLL